MPSRIPRFHLVVAKIASSVAMMALLAAAGCAHRYATPGRGANLQALGLAPQTREAQTDWSIRQALQKQPLATFPTPLAVVRIQEPCYHSRTADGWGSGRYSIVTTRDIEKDEHFARLEKMPHVTAVAPMNRLLFPSSEFQSDMELRAAAGALHADMLLVYTLDTTFQTDDAAVPLTVISLGLSPNRVVRAVTTASAVFVGTHNGYIYGLAEATARTDRLASAWTDSQAIDDARRKTEAEAFTSLIAELERTWTSIIRQHAAGATMK